MSWDRRSGTLGAATSNQQSATRGSDFLILVPFPTSYEGKMMMALWFTTPEIKQRLERPEGLCTSIAMDDSENAARIKGILDAYLADIILEEATRTSDVWFLVSEIPMDFSNARYRIAQ